LKSAEERFAQQRIEEKCLKGSWKISVKACYTEGFVMGQMVGLESMSECNQLKQSLQRSDLFSFCRSEQDRSMG
jgi:hypothetical protein